MDRLFGGHPTPAIDLPPAGHPGWDLVSWAEQLEVRGDLVGGKWTGPDEAHLPFEDIPELRQLVEAETAQDLPDPGQAGIGLELEEGGRGVDRAVDVHLHRAELEHPEDPATLGDALLTEEHRSWRAEADGNGDCGPERNADHQGGRRHDQIEGTLYRGLRSGQPDGPDGQRDRSPNLLEGQPRGESLGQVRRDAYLQAFLAGDLGDLEDVLGADGGGGDEEAVGFVLVDQLPEITDVANDSKPVRGNRGISCPHIADRGEA